MGVDTLFLIRHIMAKLLITILLLLIGLFSIGQSYDSLKKYSYFMAGFKIIGIGEIHTSGGTGFFIRDSTDIYFVTSKHVLTGCNDSSIKEKNHPDNIDIWLSGKNIADNKVVHLNTVKIKDTALCLPNYIDPDVIILKSANPKDLESVYSVEKFIHDRFEQISNLVIYGYPEDIKTPPLNKYPLDSLIFLDGSYEISNGMKYLNTQIEDSINYLIYPNKWNYKELHGFSGSPVFIQNKKTNEWRIIGVLCAGGSNNKRIVVPKIEIVIGRMASCHSF